MPNRLKLVGDYVREGGGFAMIGGWMAFGGFHGKAHYAYSPIANLLPVKIAPHDDRMEIPQGIHPKVSTEHGDTCGLAEGMARSLGLQQGRTTGWHTAGRVPRHAGHPLLIVDEVGKGRVGVFTSDILPHWGSPRFIEWAGYVPFWEQFFRWLARDAGIRAGIPRPR